MINQLVCAPKLSLPSATDDTGLRVFQCKAISVTGERHSTKFIPHNKPHARDVWGWEAKWLLLSGARDRPGCGGGLYGGVELVNRGKIQ